MIATSHPLLQSGGAVRRDTGTWTMEVSPTWASWSGPLGGLVHAVATCAALDVVGADVVPHTTNLQFIRRFSTSPVTFTATLERAGSSISFVSVRAVQDGATSCIASVVCGPSGPNGTRQHVDAPEVAQPEECPEIRFPEQLVPFGAQFEIRMACGEYPMSGADRAEIGTWLRLRDAVPVDHLVAIVMLDAMPPGLYPTLTEPAAIVSAELSIHLHADLTSRPVDDHVLAVQRTVADGTLTCVDEATLWTREGALLAQSRQLRRILGPVR